MPTFSLIVPIYKIETYLPKCIDSVLAQSCQDYELLLIDDGSPDGCGAICDRYAAQYPEKIRAVHQPNGGAGAARNHGIRLAQGSYLLFVDGDDYLAPNLIEDLSACLDKHPADLIYFGAQVEKDGKKVGELHEQIPANRLCSLGDCPDLHFGVMAPWNRAYRKALFSENQIEFATKVWYEDIRVVSKILAVAESAYRLPGAYYHYLQREGSAMNNKNSGRNVEILYAFDDILDWYRSHGFYDSHKQILEFQAIQHILLAATVRVLLIDRRHPLVGEFRSYMHKHFPDFETNSYLAQLDRNKKLVYRLLLKQRYRSVTLLFRLKELLGK